MKLISTRSELLENVERLASYAAEASGPEADFARQLIQRGICFVVVSRARGTFFAPSRFVGYAGNSRHRHRRNDDKDGRETNAVLTRVIGCKPLPSDRLEREYEAFCGGLDIEPRQAGNFGITRKFWDLR